MKNVLNRLSIWTRNILQKIIYAYKNFHRVLKEKEIYAKIFSPPPKVLVTYFFLTQHLLQMMSKDDMVNEALKRIPNPDVQLVKDLCDELRTVDQVVQ